MRRDEGYGKRRGLSSLSSETQTLIFVILGGVGFVLGYVLDFVGGLGVLLVWSALMLSVPARLDRDNSDRSKEVLAQCYALASFGGMAAIGLGVRMIVSIFN